MGVNLGCANRVILVEHWWSLSEDTQAFHRVVRLDQTKPVHLVKIVAQDTIDDHILEVQDKKRCALARELGRDPTQSVEDIEFKDCLDYILRYGSTRY